MKAKSQALSVSLILASILVAVLVLPAPALSQDAVEEEETDVEELIITGSRARPRSATDSTVPVDSFTPEQIGYQASGDLTEAIKNLLPYYSATPLTGDGSAFVRSTSLRGLPPGEVLVLINSKRRHRSALIQHFGAAMSQGDQAVDIGMIPGISIKRVEVLRDGAAAQYGSDAIAGVMNFLLDDADEGGRIEAQYGGFYAGERTVKVAGNMGFQLTDKGFLNVSGEYVDAQQLIRGFQPAAAAAAIAGGNTSVGLDSPYEGDTLAQTWGRPETHGFRGVWNMGIDLSDTMELYSFGNYADTYGNYRFFYRAPDKAGVLTSVPQVPGNPDLGNFSWGDTLPGGFTPFLEGDQEDLSVVAGLRGEFAIGSGLLYDFSTSYGSNLLQYTLNNTLNPSWGPQSQRDFHPGDLEQFETNLDGDFVYELQETINLAFGGEWREESYRMFAGDLQSYTIGPWGGSSEYIDPDTGVAYNEPASGSNGMSGATPEASGTYSRDNWALYADLEWEILEDLLIQGAVRYEDFSDFGSTTNGKVAARYTVTDYLTLRGAFSTGFRAPTPGQSNWTGIVTTFDSVSGLQTQEGTVSPTSAAAVANGGKALGPEDSQNFSIGFASNPLEDVTLTVDYYQIDVDNRIVKSVNIPYVGPEPYSTISFYTNGLNTETSGLDAVVTYWASFYGDATTNFSLAYSWNETDVASQNQVNGINPVDDATVFNIENNLPKHRFVVTVVHEVGQWTLMGRLNYYGATIDERNQREPVDSALFFDASATYALTDQIWVTGGGINIFDEYPSNVDTRLANGLAHPRRTPLGYDGGMWYMRLGYTF